MLLPARYKFVIWQGATFRSTLTLLVDEDDTPFDLNGYSAELIIRAAPQGDELLRLATDTNTIFIDPVEATIELYISAEDTADLDWEIGYYDLTITGPGSGDTDAILYGTFSVRGV